MATAAAADAEAKRRRREQWIAAITEAERELEEINTRMDVHQQAHYGFTDDRHRTIADSEDTEDAETIQEWINHLEHMASPVSSDVRQDTAVRFRKHRDIEREDDLKSLHPLVQTPSHYLGRTAIPEKFRVSRSSMYASPLRRLQWRRSWTSKKTLVTELSIAKLTTRFLLYSYRNANRNVSSKLSDATSDWKTDFKPFANNDAPDHEPMKQIARHESESPKNAASTYVLQERKENATTLDGITGTQFTEADVANLEDRLQQVVHQLFKSKDIDAENSDELESVDYPRYEENNDEKEEGVLALNLSLDAVFNKCGRGELNLHDTLSKISYNLLISRQAPNCATYNILMSYLSRLGYHDLVDMVLASFWETRIRPNEMTVNIIITHHSRQRDYGHFRRFVQKLDGEHGGLMLARPDLPPIVLVRGVGASRLIQKGNKTIQLLTLDQYTYDSIVAGFLRFDDIEIALSWYRRMLNDDFEPDIYVLTAFMRYFCKHDDWERALGTWSNIESKLTNWTMTDWSKRPSHVTTSIPVLKAYRCILGHSKRLGKDEIFSRIYEDALSRGFSSESLLQSQPPLRGFTKEEQALERLSRTVSIITHRISLLAIDLRTWAVRTLATKVILRGLDVETVRGVFQKYSDQRGFEAWLAQRPWLRYSERRQRALVKAGVQVNQEGLIKTLRFNQSTQRGKSDGAKAKRSDEEQQSSTPAKNINELHGDDPFDGITQGSSHNKHSDL